MRRAKREKDTRYRSFDELVSTKKREGERKRKMYTCIERRGREKKKRKSGANKFDLSVNYQEGKFVVDRDEG